jgi:hypothetical protein
MVQFDKAVGAPFFGVALTRPSESWVTLFKLEESVHSHVEQNRLGSLTLCGNIRFPIDTEPPYHGVGPLQAFGAPGYKQSEIHLVF